MEFGTYLFNSLRIGVKKQYRNRPVFSDGKLTPELYNYIKDSLYSDQFTHLYGCYNEDVMSIQVECENGLFYIVICNEMEGTSYTYLNYKNREDASLIDVGGSSISKKYICEDKETIMKIIITFLTTGKPYDKCEWFKQIQ